MSVPTGFIESICVLNDLAPINWQIIFPGTYNPYWAKTAIRYYETFAKTLQRFGTDFVDEKVRIYREYVDQLLPRKAKIYTLHEDYLDNQKLIDQLVQNTSR